MSVRTTSNNGVVIVSLAGAADAAMLVPLRDALADALAEARVLVLDLDELDGVDAEALRGVLVDLLDDVRGGQLRIAASDPDIRSQLAGARIHHLVAVHHSVAEAIESCDGAGR